MLFPLPLTVSAIQPRLGAPGCIAHHRGACLSLLPHRPETYKRSRLSASLPSTATRQQWLRLPPRSISWLLCSTYPSQSGLAADDVITLFPWNTVEHIVYADRI